MYATDITCAKTEVVASKAGTSRFSGDFGPASSGAGPASIPVSHSTIPSCNSLRFRTATAAEDAFPACPPSRHLTLAMSALRILVPVKRVIDYAVGLPPATRPDPLLALDTSAASPRRGLRAQPRAGNGRANTAAPALHRSNRESTRPRRRSRRPASSTA